MALSEVTKMGVAIANDMESGVPMFENPAAEIAGNLAGTATSAVADMGTKLAALPLEAASSVTDAITRAISKVQGILDAGSGLFSHMETMIFGDDEGGPLSGGLLSNMSRAKSANVLSNTFAEASGGASDTCDAIHDMMASVMGAGKLLIGTALGAIQKVQELVNELVAAVTSAIQSAIDTAIGLINEAVAQLQGLIDEAIGLVQNEIKKFTDWMTKQINFALGGFLAALREDFCMGPILDSIGSAELKGHLNIQF